MKHEELERIEALNAARTQELVRVGPLEGTTPEKWAQTVEQFAYISKAHGDADPQFWAVAIESPEQDGDVVTAMTGNGPTSKANAEFYAACHWAVPALLRHIEEVEAERDRLRAERVQLRQIIEQVAEHNPYPADIFIEPTKEQYTAFNAYLKEFGLDPAAYNGSMGRRTWRVCCEDVLKAFDEYIEDTDEAALEGGAR